MNTPLGRGRGRPEEVRELFSHLAGHYDRFNGLASLGMDSLWRGALLERLRPGEKVADVGTGTGRLALGANSLGARVVGVDFSREMLGKAFTKSDKILWVCAEASRLPLVSGEVDVVMSAFVLRNLFRAGVLEKSLQEARRVLRPGGRWLAVDLTRPSSKTLRALHDLFVKLFLGRIGRWVAGPHWPEGYLESTLAELPSQENWRGWLQACGFRQVTIKPLWGGLVSLFEAEVASHH